MTGPDEIWEIAQIQEAARCGESLTQVFRELALPNTEITSVQLIRWLVLAFQVSIADGGRIATQTLKHRAQDWPSREANALLAPYVDEWLKKH